MWNRPQKRFDQLLDQLTSPEVVEHDFAKIYQLCDIVKSNEISPVIAFNRIKKKLPPNNKDLIVNSLALECLGIMAKNCGHKFYEQLGNQEFLQQLRDFISTAPDAYRSKALDLLQSWALGIDHNDRTVLINLMYLSLKSKGFSFPEVDVKDLRAMYQTCTPVEWADGRRCYRCRSDFTATLRKHHCRKCGQVVCYSCSSKRMALPEFGIDNEVRVCDTCYNQKISKYVEYDIPVTEAFSHPQSSDFKLSPGLVDQGYLQLFDDEDTQLNLALEISRQEAENANKKNERTVSSFDTTDKRVETLAGFYPDLQAVSGIDTTNYALSSNPSTYYTNSAAYNGEVPLSKEYTNPYTQSVTPTSQSSNSVLRFDRYNPSAPSPADTISETDLSVHQTDLNVAQNFLANENLLYKSEESQANALPEENQHHKIVDPLVNMIHGKINLFNLRLKRNQTRSRSTANDQYARSLCVSLTELEPQLVDQLNELEERRVYFESLQDKLTEIIEIRRALDELRRDAYTKRLNEQGNQEELRRKMLELKRNELRVEKVIRQPLLPPGMVIAEPVNSAQNKYISDTIPSLSASSQNIHYEPPVNVHNNVNHSFLIKEQVHTADVDNRMPQIRQDIKVTQAVDSMNTRMNVLSFDDNKAIDSISKVSESTEAHEFLSHSSPATQPAIMDSPIEMLTTIDFSTKDSPVVNPKTDNLTTLNESLQFTNIAEDIAFGSSKIVDQDEYLLGSENIESLGTQ
ncbi:hypothetical protein GJ496_008636 [Pomphorhynchus laevis]|nr:hypothetical protein GJ496_008636 [Pomphorhynchus laevis]